MTTLRLLLVFVQARFRRRFQGCAASSRRVRGPRPTSRRDRAVAGDRVDARPRGVSARAGIDGAGAVDVRQEANGEMRHGVLLQLGQRTEGHLGGVALPERIDQRQVAWVGRRFTALSRR